MSMTLMPSNGPMAQFAPRTTAIRPALLWGPSNGRPLRRSRRAQRMAACARWRLFLRRFFLRPGVAFPGQALQLFILLAEAVGDAGFVPFAGGGGGLFDQLPDVVFQNPDPVVEFCQ